MQTEGLWGLISGPEYIEQPRQALCSLSDSKYQPIDDTGLTALASKFIFLFMESAAVSQTSALMLTSQN